MDLKVEIKNDVNQKEWDDMLLSNEASSSYQIYNFSRIYKEAYDSKPIFIYVKNASGKIVGQLLALIHNKRYWWDANVFTKTIGLTLNLHTSLNWFYGPVIHNSEHKELIINKFITAIEEVAKTNSVTIIQGGSAPLSDNSTDILFKNNGYDLTPWVTYHIDLTQDIQTLYRNLKKSTRYDIRKSETVGLQFEVVDKRETMNEFTRLKHEEKKRIGERLGSATQNFFTDLLWKYFYNEGYEKLFLARFDGEVVGGIYGRIFNNNMIQYGVSNTPRKELFVGPFLTWNVIKWAKEFGLESFDMGGANPNPKNEKEKQIKFYKSKWGGELKEYSRFSKILSKKKNILSSALRTPWRIPSKVVGKLK